MDHSKRTAAIGGKIQQLDDWNGYYWRKIFVLWWVSYNILYSNSLIKTVFRTADKVKSYITPFDLGIKRR